MVRRHVRASRSNTHQSAARSRGSGRHASVPSFHDGQHAAEIAPGTPLEERVLRMEETQNEILRLLREAQPPTNARGALAQQSARTGVPSVPRARSETHHQRDELRDTASSTHPPVANNPDPQLPPPREGVIPPPGIREEVRRLLREEFPARERSLFVARRGSQEVSPFTQVVQQFPIPAGFKLPNVEPYDGTSDPYEHVDHFRTIMHIQRAPDALLCQVFPATLKGQARTWFYSLPGGNINNFDELSDMFTEQFMANRRIVKDSSHLSGIRQNEGETLKEYFQRFSMEARQIPGVDPELLRGVFLGGLRPGPFYSSLMRETVRSYADLIYRVEAQIAADEAITTHRKQFESSSTKQKSNPADVTYPSQRKKFKLHKEEGLPPQPPRPDRRSNEGYTPLNTSRVNVLMAVENKGILKWPKPLKNPSGGDQSQYCHFHRTKGHSVENCFHLKEEIERLVKQGYLGQFVQDRILHDEGDTSAARQQAQKQPGDRQFVGEILTIA